MSVQTADYLDAVTHLPTGGKLTFYEIDWEEYERLLAQLGDDFHLRVCYSDGRLEIMSPSAKHEKYKNLIHDLVLIISDELDREILSFGSTTLKLKPQRKGAEGDDCFYIQHAGDIKAKDQIDLEFDPPPDLVVEIDLTHESSSKFAIYAAMGVPEIWRYDGGRWQIMHLADQSYSLAPASLAFPFLIAEKIEEFVDTSVSGSPKHARRVFREWVRINGRSNS
jgi:Uma2 family endonuclease